MSAAILLVLALAAPPAGETRISLDVREAPVADVLSLLADVGGFQLVVAPGISCPVTLKLREVRWQAALDLALRSCGLAQDDADGVIWVDRPASLEERFRVERQLAEARARGRAATPRVSTFRLSYGRAEELAPLLRKRLSPHGEVIVDARTNTLIIVDAP